MSLLGIVIGIVGILLLVGLIDGVTADFESAFSSIQGITVREKISGPSTLSAVDVLYADEIEKFQGVQVAIPLNVQLIKEIDGKGMEFAFAEPPRVYGADIAKMNQSKGESFNDQVGEGDSLRPQDLGYLLMGYELAERYNKTVGQTIEIDDKKFKIKGILEEDFRTLSVSVLMNIEDAREVYGLKDNKSTAILVNMSDPSKEDKVTKLINFKFEDLDAVPASSLGDSVGGFLDSLRLLVIVIGAIAAIVGGIGIINTMLMNVLERYREIGSLLATGWPKNQVLLLFVYESVLVGMIGGVIGILVGVGIAYYVSTTFDLQILITPILMLEALIFSFLLGLIAGIYPAKKASDMDPVEALTSY